MFLILLRAFAWVYYCRAFFFWFCSVYHCVYRAALSSENVWHQFLCRWHVTATLKNRPALQRRDILTVSLASSCFRNLLRSSSTQNLVFLFFKACYTLPFSSKHFFLGLFVRSLSTQLLFLVVLLPLLLSMTAFSYVGLLSLFLVRLFHALYLSHLPPSSFLEGLSSEQFAELESVHLLVLFQLALVLWPFYRQCVCS